MIALHEALELYLENETCADSVDARQQIPPPPQAATRDTRRIAAQTPPLVA